MNGTGRIDEEMFVAAYQELEPQLRPAEMRELFQALDIDGSGVLTFDEINFLERWGSTVRHSGVMENEQANAKKQARSYLRWTNNVIHRKEEVQRDFKVAQRREAGPFGLILPP